MANTTITVPTGTMRALGQAFAPVDSLRSENQTVSIHISDRDISIRDLAAFLELADRIYGRISESSFLSYARREHGHVQISRLTKGSWKLQLVELLGSTPSYAIILIGLVLKYLPTFAEGYKNVQQGRLDKQRRKLIIEQLKREKRLQNLDARQLASISDQIDKLLEKDQELLHRAARFAEKDLLEVEISGTSTKEPD